MATPATVLRGTSGRSVEEALSFALAHRIRIEILTALHEGPRTTAELSRILGLPLSNLTYHVEELLASGSIEVADTRRTGNVIQNVYRVVELPEYTSEEFAERTEEERKATLALVLQDSMAEAMAALSAGKLAADPLVMLAWNRITLDETGRRDLADEQDRSWLRIREIEGEAANRRASSGDDGGTFVVTSFGYPRSRPEPAPAIREKPVDQ